MGICKLSGVVGSRCWTPLATTTWASAGAQNSVPSSWLLGKGILALAWGVPYSPTRVVAGIERRTCGLT